jgi:molybdopterin/thiamine biosynthesis adenylyltransferase
MEVRLGNAMFTALRMHLETAVHGEEAAFLICGYANVGGDHVLLVREWLPVPERAKVRRGRYGLEWTAAFSAEVLAHADRAGAAAVLIHAHPGSRAPGPSSDDSKTARSLMPGFSRVLGLPCGAIVLGDGAASGTFWRDGRSVGAHVRIRVVGQPTEVLLPTPVSPPRTEPKRRHDRTTRALGPRAEQRIASASVGVVGLCGGGSHVCQQLAHLGVGRIVAVDDDVVDEVNLGRMVGSTPRDVRRTLKTRVMARLITTIDPAIRVEQVPSRFPAPETLAALKTVDVVVACVDSFLVREQINEFCRRQHLPLIDIGLGIETVDGQLRSAYGQVTLALPSGACLRCSPLLADAVLEKERRERPPGYDRNPYAQGDPQVVSMNGALASEAVNLALDLITGYASGKRSTNWWLYDGRAGTMTRTEPFGRRAACPACAQEGHGDPRHA